MQINTLELKQFLEEKIQETQKIMDRLDIQNLDSSEWMNRMMAFKEVLDYITITETT